MLTHRFRPHLLAAAALTALLAASGTAALAQTTGGRSVAPVAAPAPNAAAATANALPSPGGLRSPLISPGGITTQPLAGLPAAPAGSTGSGRPIPTDSTAGGGNGGAGNGNASGAVPATNVLGGAGSYAGPMAMGTGPFATVDVARSFLQADADRSGDLTRSEAQRLSISPFSFEEMDRDGNGAVTRWEYEDVLRAR